MAYDGRILRRAQERFEADRAERREQLEQRREAAYRLRPRLREVDGELRSTAGRILSAALRRGTDPLPELRKLREGNLRLQAEKKAILRECGLPDNALDDVPACPLCGDTGYRDGQVCGGKGCLRSYYAREQQRELSRLLDLGSQSFASFSLQWYSERYDDKWEMSPRSHMRMVLETCQDYARHFGERMENLLLFGPPGLGKTFLSAAIAREVSGGGFSVVYDTAGRIFERFEDRKFTREEAAEGDVARSLSCDLLILDDLGTEMVTAFVQSALYRIVNTRLLERRSTIINTNLGLEAISQRYTPQIASRLEGEYRILTFFGEDIRKLKRERGLADRPYRGGLR